MFINIDYTIYFKYNIENIFEWCDEFKLNKEWEIIRINKIRNVEKSYMGKKPYQLTNKEYEIAIFNKNRWIYLNKGEGITNGMTLNIKNLDYKIIKKEPKTVIFKKNFDFHVMMTVIQSKENIKIVENKKLSIKEGVLISNKLKMNIYNSIISYRGKYHNEFKCFCENIYNIYLNEKDEIETLFKKLSITDSNTHKSIAYKTWYKAKREIQNEWPNISTVKIENGIEFPENSNIWYYGNNNTKVKLIKRKDDNDEIYIPKLFKNLSYDIENIKLTQLLKNNNELNIKIRKVIKMLEDEKHIELNYKGKIISSEEGAEYVSYNGMIIYKLKNKINLDKCEAQILDENNKVVKIYIDNKWKNPKNNVPNRNKIIIPHYYKSILYDLKKLNKIENGDYTDLRDIGIVTNKTKTITWPIKELDDYIPYSMETTRLITFKYQKNVEYMIVQ